MGEFNVLHSRKLSIGKDILLSFCELFSGCFIVILLPSLSLAVFLYGVMVLCSGILWILFFLLVILLKIFALCLSWYLHRAYYTYNRLFQANINFDVTIHIFTLLPHILHLWCQNGHHFVKYIPWQFILAIVFINSFVF